MILKCSNSAELPFEVLAGLELGAALGFGAGVGPGELGDDVSDGSEIAGAVGGVLDPPDPLAHADQANDAETKIATNRSRRIRVAGPPAFISSTHSPYPTDAVHDSLNFDGKGHHALRLTLTEFAFECTSIKACLILADSEYGTCNLAVAL